MQGFDDDGDGREGSAAGSSDRDDDDENDDYRAMDDMDYRGQDDYGEGENEEETNDDDENDNENEDDNPDQDNSQNTYLRANGSNDRSSFQSQRAQANGYSIGNPLDGPILAPPTSHPRDFGEGPLTPSQNTLDFNLSSFIIAPQVRPEAVIASSYDIVPTIAAPHSTSINAVTATPDLRHVYTGGSDGYIRKFNWVETANGKLMLTVAQRHPFVDSVTKAGVLLSYWENDDPSAKTGDDGSNLSPCYSLAVHNQGLWLLSGLESGGINLQSMRHEEGKRIASLKKHSSAVSVLNLAQDEQSVLSGSWDKNVHDWDLHTGQVIRSFEGSSGQISAIEMRPFSTLPVPEITQDAIVVNGTMNVDNAEPPRVNEYTNAEAKTDSSNQIGDPASGMAADAGSSNDSLFGGNDGDSLFGDNEENNQEGEQSRATFGADDDDEFSKAIADGFQQQKTAEAEGDQSMANAEPSVETFVENLPAAVGPIPVPSEIPVASELPDNAEREAPPEEESALVNGLPHAEDLEMNIVTDGDPPDSLDALPMIDTTFLTASFDGTLRVWDKRQPLPIAKIEPRNAPPWCMGACWSPDGNFIYAGRRNGTVEEYSLHKGLRGVERSFKFPNGSGAVTAVRAMPNGRHLICASFDILRLYDLQQQQTFKHSSVPFLIVPGHRTGVVSQLYIDPTCRYMITTAGNRGWEGASTEVLLGYEIGVVQ
ncbi:Transcription factor spt8 [Agyrium rufum]|nr:Transcription factor spt8 [Agyrium rufum]